ncbi:MAG: 1-deoxy-D-xylulose-5-phosphate reductoisomerase [Planctomycetota bacterium]
MASRRVIILGSTGSIGTQTLDVIAHLNALHDRGDWHERLDVVGLAAGARGDLLARQAAEFGVRHLALAEGEPTAPADGRAWSGVDAAEQLVRETDAEVVVAAIVGAAGLAATLAAVELGRDVVLANKETLVAAGALVVPAAERSGAKLLPVDSEHSALWQCVQELSVHGAGGGVAVAPPMGETPTIERLILTASGGPFREWSREAIERATPKEALNHPTWSMGQKVTIDSASLMNKGLEVLEAHWLYGLGGDRIDVLVHPQVIVHSMVEFVDGSVMAQLGSADMRTPIQYAFTWPTRIGGRAEHVSLADLTRLDFEPPDLERFPALGLAYDAIAAGGTSGAVLNAANESSVEAFLAGRIPFGAIPKLVRDAMEHLGSASVTSMGDVLDADTRARAFIAQRLPA